MRDLHIEIEREHLAGVYANVVQIDSSEYETTLTFACAELHMVEGSVPGVCVGRIRISDKLGRQLATTLAEHFSKQNAVKEIRELPEVDQ